MSTITSCQLACDTPLIVEEVGGVRSASMCLLLPCGAAYDRPAKLGRSALWAELLMRGAGGLNSRDQADAFDRLGASRSTEVGSYTFRLGAVMLGSRVRDVLPLLVDSFRRPRMDEEAIEPSRDLALQAIDAVKDDPQQRAMILLRSRHHPTPLDRSGLGTPEGIRALSRAELLGEWPTSAVPKGSIFAFAGAVNADELRCELDRLLDGWSGAIAEPALGQPPQRGCYHEHDESSQVQIVLAHDAPSEPHPDSILEKYCVSVLSGGMAGRLFTEVREKRGLCYSVSAGYRPDRDYGVVSAFVGTTPERAQDSLDVLFAELQRISSPQGRVTPEEFARARVGMKSSLVFSGESTGARSVALASDQRKIGRPRSLEEMARAVDEVTLDQLNAYLARRSMGTITIQTLGPKALRPPPGVPMRG